MNINIHTIQSFPPSNLNRDDTGAPKDASFGGYRRARVSSQCRKRAIRTYLQDNGLREDMRATRTKNGHLLIAERVASHGVDPETAMKITTEVLRENGIMKKKEDTGDSLILWSNKELDVLAEAIATDHQKGNKTSKNTLQESFQNGGAAFSVSMFGRMLAKFPEARVDAACSVAHSISTHSITSDSDYFTAVDDLTPDNESGAGHLGENLFYAPVLYGFASIDLHQLVRNLAEGHGDELAEALAIEAVMGFLTASALSRPSGNQSTFAATTVPAAILVTAGGLNLSLANAFLDPIDVRRGNAEKLSTQAMIDHYQQLKSAYGIADQAVLLDVNGQAVGDINRAASLDELKSSVTDLIQ